MQFTMTNNFHGTKAVVSAHKIYQSSHIAVVSADQLNQALSKLCPGGPGVCECSEWTGTGINENGEKFTLKSPLEFEFFDSI